MRPVPLWGRCIGSTDFTSRKKKMRKWDRGDEAKFDDEISESYGSRFQAVLPVLNLRVMQKIDEMHIKISSMLWIMFSVVDT